MSEPVDLTTTTEIAAPLASAAFQRLTSYPRPHAMAGQFMV